MKSIGPHLFESPRAGAPQPRSALQRADAKALGLKESWFRDAIFSEPELVVGPCRAAGRVDSDEVWIPWRTEVNFGSGPIDVLLLSSHGRIGLVETKLSYNPQKRREVVAQVLDYALALQDLDRDELPELPASEHAPLEEDLIECLRTGRFLLVIAGDALDPRALRLSQSMLARHLTSEWDLAMVDLNVYMRPADPAHLLLAPELLGVVQAEVRQVVRVEVQGETTRARVTVETVADPASRAVPRSHMASVDEFLQQAKRQVPQQHAAAERIVALMQQIAARNERLLSFGLRTVSASLYYMAPSGPKRFLSLRTDGRLRLVLVYLREAGADTLVDALVEAARPVLSISRNDRAAGIRYISSNEGAIADLLHRIEAAVMQSK